MKLMQLKLNNMRKIQTFINEINKSSKNIQTFNQNESQKVHDIYKEIILRFHNIDKSNFEDSYDYNLYQLYCKSTEALRNLELDWLKKESSLATDHNYLQIREGLNGMVRILSISIN